MARGKQGGKRAGPRRTVERAPVARGRLLVLSLGITLTVVAWGYLVWAAIDFGSAARSGGSGEQEGWWLFALATVGAVACLFTAMLLAARIFRLVVDRPVVEPSRHSTTGTSSS